MLRLFRISVPTSVRVLLVSEVLLLGCSFVVAVFLVMEVDPTVFLLYDGGLARILVVVASLMLALHFLDHYAVRRPPSRAVVVLRIGQAFGFAFLLQAVLAYMNREWILPRWVMVTGSLLGILFLVLWRAFYDAVLARAIGGNRLLFVGVSRVVQQIASHLEQYPELGMTNLGYLDDQREPGSVLNGGKVLGPLSDLRKISSQIHPDRVVVGVPEGRQRLPVQDLLDLRFGGVLIEEAAATYEAVRGRIPARELPAAPLVFSGQLEPRASYVRLQALYSPVLALVAALATLPLTLAVALAVKLGSRGPILSRQTCLGLLGRPFTLYRFRCTYADARARNAARTDKEDPHLTPAGRWLRRLRLDALPQLLNVVKGDMSLVGPRPERPEVVKVLSEKIPFYSQRHLVKPGITGWAQINSQSGETLEDTITKLEYDLYYIKHLSPALDAYIILQTFKTILRLRGAP